MGLFDITQKVVTTYIANTSDHKAKIRELSGEQKKAAKVQLDALEAQNRKVGDHIKMIGKASAAVAAIGLAYKAVDVIMDAFSDKQARNMRMLQDEVVKLGDGGILAFEKWGDAADRLALRLMAQADYFAEMKKIMGVIATEEKNAHLEKEYGYWNKDALELGIKSTTDTIKSAGLMPEDTKDQILAKHVALTQAYEIRAFMIGKIAEREREADAAASKSEANRLKALKEWEKNAANRPGAYGIYGDYWNPGGNEAANANMIAESNRRRAAGLGPGSSGASIRGLDLNLNSGLAGDDRFGVTTNGLANLGMQGLDEAYGQSMTFGRTAGDKRTTLLESIFGTADEMDVMRGAFASLSGTVQDSFDAWVDKSGKADFSFKKLFREILASSAKLMFGQAITHGAMALGEWAWGNNAKAAKHGAAALKFAAGAVAVGAVARQLGGGGAGSSAGAGGGGAVALPHSSGSGGSSDRPLNVYYGDDWAYKSRREREIEAGQVVRTARRNESSAGRHS